MIFTSLLTLFAYALTLPTPHPIDLNSGKVAHLSGVIDQESEMTFMLEALTTEGLPGDRILFIDSPGGEVGAGRRMLALLENEQARGVRLVCVVEGQAASMAFNILSHCDVKLATAHSKLLAHKVAVGGLPPTLRLTAKALRKIASDLDKVDEPFRRANAKAMHMSLARYDYYADQEKMWTPQELLDIHYLDGIVAFTIVP